MKTAILALFLMTAVSSACADPDPTQDELVDVALKIPNQLLQAGYRTFGDFDLMAMKAAILANGVTFVMVDQFPKVTDRDPSAASVDFRKDGRYDAARGIVYLLRGDRFQALRKSDAFPLFLFHEALGAIGYPDYIYTLSVSLYWISLEKDPAVQQALWKKLEPDFKNFRTSQRERFGRTKTIERGGGGSQIGGGGDLDGLEVKFEILENFKTAGEILARKKLYGPSDPMRRYFLFESNVLVVDEIPGNHDYFCDSGGVVYVKRAYWYSLDEPRKMRMFVDIVDQFPVTIQDILMTGKL